MQHNTPTVLRASLPFAGAALLFATVQARGAGFALYEGSARGNVTPAALTAGSGEEASGLYFNPAEIAGLPGTQIQFGTTEIVPTADVSTVNPYTGEKNRSYGDGKVWTIPHFYLTHQLSDELWFGFGLGTRYGLGAKFKETWPGRYSNYKAEILSIDAMPTLAWQVTDRLAVAAGVSIRYFDIELAQKIDVAGASGLRNYNDPSPSPYDVDQNFHGDDVRPALDLGLTWKITDTVTFGAAYHSRIHFHVEGDAKWRKPPAVQAMAPAFFNDMSFRSKNYNPDEYLAAFSWKATDALTLSAGATYTTWHLYDDLVIELERDMMPGRRVLQSYKGWNDTWRLSFGADYALTDEWTLRAGYIWDQSPINGAHPDYLVPGDNRHIFAVGAGWRGEAWSVECSYFYEPVENFDVKGDPAHGVYDGQYCGASAHSVAWTVGYRF